MEENFRIQLAKPMVPVFHTMSTNRRNLFRNAIEFLAIELGVGVQYMDSAQTKV